MPDRVAIIGGSIVGRDHFPIAVGDYSGGLGDDTENGFIVDLSTAVRWFYLVRQWRVAAYIELNQTLSPDPENNQIIDISGDFFVHYGSGPTTLTRESDIVRSSLDAGGSVASGTNQMIAAIHPQFLQWAGDGLFFFPIYVHAWSGDVEMTIQTQIASTGDGGPTPDTGPSSNGFQCEGVTSNIFYFLGSDRTLVSASIIVTPLLFWPYATKAGLPIYDAATGATLRDPLS